MTSKPKDKTLVGVFVEGNLRDRTRDSVETVWRKLASRCESKPALKVYGIDKGQIVGLKPSSVQRKPGATQVLSRRVPLDVEIDRAVRQDLLTHVVVAFDAWPPNELLDPNGRREEIGFLLTGLQSSSVLAEPFKNAAGALAARYGTAGCLDPRTGSVGILEVIYMDPMFEALLTSDEATVRRALGHSSTPKDWPKFKTHSRELDKHVMKPAVAVAHKDVLRKMGGEYLDRKTAWGIRILEEAANDAGLWAHEIAQRVCRLLCNLPRLGK
jgi:hypothetical protein